MPLGCRSDHQSREIRLHVLAVLRVLWSCYASLEARLRGLVPVLPRTSVVAVLLNADNRIECAMAQPSNTRPHGYAGPVSPVGAQITRDVVVLEAAGRLSDVVEDLDLAIQLALVEKPRGVVCDLSAVLEGAEPDAIALLATAGRHVRDWAAIPVAFACQDPQLRGALTAYPLGGHLIVTATMASAVSAVAESPIPAVHWLRLAPHPTAPRASRDFVTRALLDWRLGRVIPAASLVVSELVTNSTMYAGTDIALSVAWHLGALRLAVRDNSARLPRQVYSTLDLHGRGLTIVAGLSRAFGVLPASDGGKVVWAVLDAPQPGTSAREGRINPASKGSPMITTPDRIPQLNRRPLPPVQPEGYDAFPQRGGSVHRRHSEPSNYLG